MKFDWFLMAMAGAVVAAIAAPTVGSSGSAIPWSTIAQVGIFIVFFLHGANLSRESLKVGSSNWKLHVFVQSTTFMFFPLIGMAIFLITRTWLSPEIALGFFYLGALSSTVSSAIATVSIARGNISAAIFNATLSGLIGMILTPFLISFVHGQAQGALSPVEAVGDIAVKLLLPFAAGHLLRPQLGAAIARHKAWLTKLDRGVILLIIYTAFCNSTEAGVWRQVSPSVILGVAALVATWLAVALFLTTLLSRRLGFDLEDQITAVICGSQKSLVNGAPIAKILFGSGPALGAILLPLMLYHPLQLIACSVLAGRYSELRDRSRQVPAGQARVSEPS